MTAPLAETTATGEREPRFRCKHPRTAANTVYRRRHIGEPFKPVCKRCDERHKAKARAEYQANRQRKPIQWIARLSPDVLAEAKAALERELARTAVRRGRPKAAQQTMALDSHHSRLTGTAS